MSRTFDVVLFGATGFTGRLVAEYLAARPAGTLRWALAGRSAERLAAVRAELAAREPALASLELCVADSADPGALAELARSTHVVCTTVGPYLQHGGPLVAACAEHGTSYCDLTGEVPFVRASIDANHTRAAETGARIVHCAGFDSIPSDLGVWLLNDAFRARGKRLERASLFMGPVKGAFSGGTLASVLGLLEAASRDRALRRLLADPYALMPDRARDRGPDGGDPAKVRFEPRLGQWTGPFLMAAVNSRVVRRSNALQDYAYGRGFSYDEQMAFGRGAAGLARATATTAALAGLVLAGTSSLGRAALRRVSPAPGEGPSKEARDAGYFVARGVGEGDGLRLDVRVAGQSDPGYGETSKMLAETALGLALDADALPRRAGVLTPASALGGRLVERLRAAGMTFETLDAPGA